MEFDKNDSTIHFSPFICSSRRFWARIAFFYQGVEREKIKAYSFQLFFFRFHKLWAWRELWTSHGIFVPVMLSQERVSMKVWNFYFIFIIKYDLHFKFVCFLGVEWLTSQIKDTLDNKR